MDAIKIVTPGGYSTIQDQGRTGFQNMGVPLSGALDQFAYHTANLLVGNTTLAAVIELTVMGPSFEVLSAMDIALTGARMNLSVNGDPKPQWCTIRVEPGDLVAIGQVESGCRAYLGFSGGPDLPRIMGSLSTYVGGRIGGFSGRPLQADDVIKRNGSGLLSSPWTLPDEYIPEYPTEVVVRAIPGPQDDHFDRGMDTLFSSAYMVSAKADRMGYRLMGHNIPIKEGMPGSIVSEPSVPGSIQIPPDEQPIILLVEQTVGGYAKIATIISADIGRVAQTTPGDTICFEKIGLDRAHQIARDHHDMLARLNTLF
ncbi:MAG: biotin-dependent carboxyltransferase [Desulfobacteraceae bacterium]|nr:MAG: biotin-dependent carboxyltransferase [Desulfobacteraceae bacterium]